MLHNIRDHHACIYAEKNLDDKFDSIGYLPRLMTSPRRKEEAARVMMSANG